MMFVKKSGSCGNSRKAWKKYLELYEQNQNDMNNLELYEQVVLEYIVQ